MKQAAGQAHGGMAQPPLGAPLGLQPRIARTHPTRLSLSDREGRLGAPGVVEAIWNREV